MELDIYTRVSRLSDKRMLSTDGQEADCRDRVREAGATVGQVHCDPGKSAWKKGVKRPGWDALMTRIEQGKTDGVCVFDLTRFSRQPMEGERLIEAAEHGLAVLDSERDFDLTSADGKASFRDHMKMAAYQSDRMSTTVPRGKRRRARGGQPNVSSRPFGFKDDAVTVDDEEAQVIREMARRFLAGESQDAIRADLNARNITTSYGKPWNRASFRQIMMRPRNAGWIVYRGEPVSKLPGEPILDQLTHDDVLALFASRRGRPVSPRYTCSGIARCCHCGKGLTGRPRKNMKPYPDGEVRRDYWCNYSTGGCGRLAIDQRFLDNWVGDFAVRTLSDPGHADELDRVAREVEEKRKELLAEAAQREARLLEIAGRLGRDEISLARHDLICGPQEQRLAEIGLALQALAEERPEPVPSGTRTLRDFDPRGYAQVDWLIQWDEGTSAERRAILLRALNGRRLVIGPGTPSKFDPERVSVR